MATELYRNKVSGGRKRKPPDLRNDRASSLLCQPDWGWGTGDARLTCAGIWRSGRGIATGHLAAGSWKIPRLRPTARGGGGDKGSRNAIERHWLRVAFRLPSRITRSEAFFFPLQRISGCCDAEGLCYERAGARTQPTIRPGAHVKGVVLRHNLDVLRKESGDGV